MSTISVDRGDPPSIPSPSWLQHFPPGRGQHATKMTIPDRTGIMSPMRDDLSTALSYHQQGLLDQAARIYQIFVDRDPAHADALHLLGVVALQQGNPARAVGRRLPHFRFTGHWPLFSPIMGPPSYRQRLFVEHYLGGSWGSAVNTARRAGYSTSHPAGVNMLRK